LNRFAEENSRILARSTGKAVLLDDANARFRQLILASIVVIHSLGCGCVGMDVHDSALTFCRRVELACVHPLLKQKNQHDKTSQMSGGTR